VQILGWAGYVRVDDTTYTFLGDPVVSGAEIAIQKSLEVLLASSFGNKLIHLDNAVHVNAKYFRDVRRASGFECKFL
jgi:hypothetical protein